MSTLPGFDKAKVAAYAQVMTLALAASVIYSAPYLRQIFKTSLLESFSLTEAQLEYAASDVLYLHRLREEMDKRLEREGRTEMAQACFDFLPMRAKLDLSGWPETDIFAHS